MTTSVKEEVKQDVELTILINQLRPFVMPTKGIGMNEIVEMIATVARKYSKKQNHELLEALKDANAALIDLYSNEYVRKFGHNEKRCIEFLNQQPVLQTIKTLISKSNINEQ